VKMPTKKEVRALTDRGFAGAVFVCFYEKSGHCSLSILTGINREEAGPISKMFLDRIGTKPDAGAASRAKGKGKKGSKSCDPKT
jgi:hypothetical protein